jgi:hypothetical protein
VRPNEPRHHDADPLSTELIMDAGYFSDEIVFSRDTLWLTAGIVSYRNVLLQSIIKIALIGILNRSILVHGTQKQ